MAFGELVVNKNITAKNRVDRKLSQANFIFYMFYLVKIFLLQGNGLSKDSYTINVL